MNTYFTQNNYVKTVTPVSTLADTIFALASGAGRSGVAVMRISGGGAGPTLCALTGKTMPEARRAAVMDLRNTSGERIDTALVLWFPSPASFTGEDVVELHIHGGRAVIAAIIDTLAKQPGLRPAEAGEFTRRAFEHGKLDLTEAEGLADLVAAETEAQRRQALRQMRGELGVLYENWRASLIGLLAHIEADIDFPDENLPDGIGQTIAPRLSELCAAIGRHLDDRRRGERLRDGLVIAIIGPVNVGKSSLLNMLARRDAAIVSEVAGTTRDVVEVHLDIGGYPVTLADTAGLRQTADSLETEGIRRALGRAACADLKIFMLDASNWPDNPITNSDLVDADTLVIANKTDLKALPADAVFAGRTVWPISVASGAGIAKFLSVLENEVETRLAVGADPLITRSRHRHALEECQAAINRAIAPDLAAELVAEDVRLAARALGRITGRVDVEDILDAIFRDFCIGK